MELPYERKRRHLKPSNAELQSYHTYDPLRSALVKLTWEFHLEFRRATLHIQTHTMQLVARLKIEEV